MPPPPAEDFTAVTESAPLVAALRDRIEREGPITFRDFMDAALYDPRWGYYRTRAAAMSRGGDYVTSPEVHPVFGALVARQIQECWQAQSSSAPFDLVEAGGGRGLLARDILAWARANAPAFAEAVRYTLVETSPVLRDEQQRALAEIDLPEGAVTWREDLPSGISGIVLSNELIDAFPVHRVVRRGDELLEVYVDRDGDRFADHLGPLSTPELRAYFDALSVLPGDGCYAEVNLDAARWMSSAAASLQRGYVLTFDYGYEARDLYAPWRRDGTLLCCYRQAASSDPYQRVGLQDITASVDFTTLRRAGEDAGLRTLAMTDQASFLVRMGIGDGVAAASAPGGAQLEEYFARRGIVLALIDPARLGRITVLLQGKDVPDAPWRGFVDA